MSSNNFSSDEIIEKCNQALKNPATFYSRQFIRTEDGLKDNHSAYRTEVIAKFICENRKCFESILNNNPRKGSYDKEHTGKHEDTGDRPEDELAIRLFNLSKTGTIFDYIGKVIDYQTPLKNGRNSAIDLLSANDKYLYILELKYIDSRESLLRCVLEAYTYKKLVDEDKLIEDFREKHGGKAEEVIAAPLISISNGEVKSPYKDLREMIDEKKPELKELMKLLGVTTVFTYEEIKGEYRIKKVAI